MFLADAGPLSLSRSRLRTAALHHSEKQPYPVLRDLGVTEGRIRALRKIQSGRVLSTSLFHLSLPRVPQES